MCLNDCAFACWLACELVTLCICSFGCFVCVCLFDMLYNCVCCCLRLVFFCSRACVWLFACICLFACILAMLFVRVPGCVFASECVCVFVCV